MPTERKARSDIQLSEDLSHLDQLPQGSDFFELNGVFVQGESQGYDFYLGTAAWHVGGGRDGIWRVDEAVMGQNTLVMVPQDRRGDFRYSETICNRQDAKEWEGALQIEQKPDEVIWHWGNRQYISRPPYWQVKGEMQGVDCDLTLGGLREASRCYGQWSELATTTRAGYEVPCWVEGSITVRGKKYTLENAFGIHDLITCGESYDHMVILRDNPYTYIWCLSESIQLFLLDLQGAGWSHGFAYLDGQEIPFSPGEVTLDVLEKWEDPLTAMVAPVRWHANMDSVAGSVDVNIAATGRGWFCVHHRGGYTPRYALPGLVNGSIRLPDGRNIAIEDMTTYVEWGRTGLPLEAGYPTT